MDLKVRGETAQNSYKNYFPFALSPPIIKRLLQPSLFFACLLLKLFFFLKPYLEVHY